MPRGALWGAFLPPLGYSPLCCPVSWSPGCSGARFAYCGIGILFTWQSCCAAWLFASCERTFSVDNVFLSCLGPHWSSIPWHSSIGSWGDSWGSSGYLWGDPSGCSSSSCGSSYSCGSSSFCSMQWFLSVFLQWFLQLWQWSLQLLFQ
jgi:hypothetical protein